MRPQILSKHCKNCKYAKLLLAVENHDGTKFTFSTLDKFIWCTRKKHPYKYTQRSCTEFLSIFENTI